MGRHRLRRLLAFVLTSAFLAGNGAIARAQWGYINSGAGAIGRVLPTTATGIDATGAIYWNPASITGLQRSELAFGVDMIFPQTRLDSTYQAGAIPPGLPFTTQSGSTWADNGVFPLPFGGLVYKPDNDSPWTFGLGIFSVGGLSVNYPASTTNPILTAQPPNGLGVGALYSQLIVLEINPVVSYQLTDHLSVGIGPAIGLASLKVDPAFITSPDTVSGFAVYPNGTHTPFIWGGGFNAGLFYTLEQGWRFGASIKSPRWFAPERFQSQTPTGQPRSFSFRADVPMIASAGIAYAGFPRWLFAIDTHYIDYTNTNATSGTGFNSAGAVTGIGWRSIWAIATGVQYQVTDGLTLRLGYNWNQNPIDGARTFFNIASPTITQNTIQVGATYQLNEDISLSAAYAHAFQHSINGPLFLPSGSSVPGTSITSTASGELFVFGVTVRFGRPRGSVRSPTIPDEESVQNPSTGQPAIQ
jgi:long-chain fatty acid transport protein